jgi:hypothetical protein
MSVLLRFEESVRSSFKVYATRTRRGLGRNVAFQVELPAVAQIHVFVGNLDGEPLGKPI